MSEKGSENNIGRREFLKRGLALGVLAFVNKEKTAEFLAKQEKEPKSPEQLAGEILNELNERVGEGITEEEFRELISLQPELVADLKFEKETDESFFLAEKNPIFYYWSDKTVSFLNLAVKEKVIAGLAMNDYNRAKSEELDGEEFRQAVTELEERRKKISSFKDLKPEEKKILPEKAKLAWEEAITYDFIQRNNVNHEAAHHVVAREFFGENYQGPNLEEFAGQFLEEVELSGDENKKFTLKELLWYGVKEDSLARVILENAEKCDWARLDIKLRNELWNQSTDPMEEYTWDKLEEDEETKLIGMARAMDVLGEYIARIVNATAGYDYSTVIKKAIDGKILQPYSEDYERLKNGVLVNHINITDEEKSLLSKVRIKGKPLFK